MNNITIRFISDKIKSIELSYVILYYKLYLLLIIFLVFISDLIYLNLTTIVLVVKFVSDNSWSIFTIGFESVNDDLIVPTASIANKINRLYKFI